MVKLHHKFLVFASSISHKHGTWLVHRSYPNLYLHPFTSVPGNAENQSYKGASEPFRQPRGLICANGLQLSLKLKVHSKNGY